MYFKHTPFDEVMIWVDALSALQDLIKISAKYKGKNNYSIGERWYGKLISSTKALLEADFECILENNQINLTEKGEENLNSHLMRLIKRIGGLNYLEYSLFNYQKRGFYDREFARYWIKREYKDHGMTHVPTKPFGLLFQLSVIDARYYKYLGKNFIDDIQELEKIALDFSIILEIDAKIGIGSTFRWKDPINNIYHYLIYNTVFIPDQMKPSHAILILKALYSPFDDSILKEKQNWGLSDLISLANFLEICKPGLQLIKVSALRKQFPHMSDLGWKSLIEANAHAQKAINLDYQPFKNLLDRENYSRINFYKKPLIQLDTENLVLVDASFCLDSINHVMFSALSSNGYSKNQILSKMGHSLEKFVVDMFRQKEFNVTVGIHKKSQGETDLLIESEMTVFLFEIKKTYRAQSTSWGHHISMLEDLTKGLAHSQAQMLRAERALRSKEGLQFTKPKPVSVYLGKRKLVRITLTLHDFGALHHPMNARNCVMALADAQFESTSTDYQNQLKGINSFTRRLEKELLSTVNVLIQPENVKEEDWNHHKFEELKHETVFLNLQHLMNILDQCKNIQDFEKEFFRLDRTSFGTHDLLWEWVYARSRSIG
ncbi:MAG: hypothetical protein HC933_08500 [Pleurocapsa sp. SU_196_0]|nr:hypothetical protein [Pleurocapsa sp. SU_196_0]